MSPWLPTGRKLAYLIAVIILVPLTIAVEYGFSKQEIDSPESRQPIVARGEAPVEYGGARWRLVSLRPGPAAEGAVLPKDTTLLFVTVEVTPLNAAASKAIEYCGFDLTNDEGDVWSRSFGLAETGGAATSCTIEVNDEDEPIPPGRTQSVVSTFLVPSAEAGRVWPVTQLRGQERKLAFRR
jgi:hypothetical protein